MKLCKDCKHYRMSLFPGYETCSSPNAAADPVSGGYRDNFCALQRQHHFNADDFCGIRGNWFELKEQPKMPVGTWSNTRVSVPPREPKPTPRRWWKFWG